MDDRLSPRGTQGRDGYMVADPEGAFISLDTLRRYGAHIAECPASFNPVACTCGLDAILGDSQASGGAVDG